MRGEETLWRIPNDGREIVRRVGRSLTWSLLHPSYDRLLLYGFADWYSRLSRAWAAGLAALASDSNPAAAVDRLPLDPRVLARDRTSLIRALGHLEGRQRAYQRAEAAWQSAFFGAERGSPEALRRAQSKRQRAAARLMAGRALFLPWRRHFPSVQWEIAAPEEVEALHAARLAPGAAFPAPEAISPTRSAVLPGHRGTIRWLRFPTPLARAREKVGDAWARVYEPPQGVPARATLIYLHGILVESEMLRTPESAVAALAGQGFRIVLPEAPWHGRRCREGSYGGEPILAGGPRGLIELFEAWVAELAALIGWFRAETDGPVAIGGVSLGALTAQLAASAARDWPAALRPDGLLLVATSGAMVELALGSSLTTRLGLPKLLAEKGWQREDLERYRPLYEPSEQPGLPPERIVMALGKGDDLTPYRDGLALARRWQLPEENLFVRRPGHFTLAMGLFGDPAPYHRLAHVMGV